MPLIYRATNTVNGKAYVGVTRQTLSARQAAHKCRAKNGAASAFYGAIRKYGWQAFVWEVLEVDVPVTQLPDRERYWITRCNTFCDGGHGYNRTFGGGGTSGLIVTAESRQKMSMAQRTRHILVFGLRKQLHLFSPCFGRKHSDEAKKRMSIAQRAKPLGSVPAKLPLAEWPKIKAMRASGYSYKKIGALYSVRPETVFYYCKRREVRPV